jgi:hypothetical protein
MVRRLAGGAIAAALLAAGVVLYAVVDWDRTAREDPSGEVGTAPVEPGVGSSAGPIVVDSAATEPTEPTEYRITFEVSPENARIFVDGQPLPDGTREVSVPAGGEPHMIDFNAEGYASQERELTADRDQTIRVVLAETKRKVRPAGKRRTGTVAKGSKEQGKKKVLKGSPY